MANIMFKRGKQAQLPSNGEYGCFYLTTDTNRLYVGNENNLIVPVNQGVINVQKVTNLPTKTNIEAGQFYYAIDENILCVYNGNQWVQINQDTNNNDTIQVTSVSVADPAVTDNEKIVYTTTLSQTKYTKDGVVVKDAVSDITFDLTLSADDLEKIIHDPASVGLEVESSGNQAIIKTTGTGADNTKTATIKGGSNVTVTQANGVITVAATDSTYQLGTLKNDDQKAAVRLTGTNNVTKDAIFEAGKDMVVSADTSAITFAHATINTTADTATDASVLTHGATVDVVTGVEANNGHVTKVTTKKYTLPADTSIDRIEGTAATPEQADWKVEIHENIGQKKFDIDFSQDAAKLKSDLQKEIADGLAAANTALTYKGTVPKKSNLPTSDVEVGDVYMLDSEDGNYKVGDLFIATAKNDNHTGGVIADDAVEWTHVPSGNELNTDTLFYGDVTVTSGNTTGGSVTYALNAKRGAEGANPAIPTENENLTISGGTDILVSGSGSSATINHKAYSSNITPDNEVAGDRETFKAITGLTINNGHVTGIKTQDFTPETYALSGAENQIQLKTGSGVGAGAIGFEGDSWIGASVTQNGVSIIHNGPVTANSNSQSVTNGTLTHGGDLNLITGVEYDSKGHVVGVTTGTVKLPGDTNVNTTYDFFLGEATNSSAATTVEKSDPYIVLRNNNNQNKTVQLKGNGSVSVSGVNNVVTVSMTWGEF